jgi:hypothetical protein
MSARSSALISPIACSFVESGFCWARDGGVASTVDVEVA